VFIVVGLIILLIASILVIRFLQKKHPKVLPEFLKDWEFLPIGLRSLKPYDRIIVKYLMCFKCCKKLTNADESDNKIVLDHQEEIANTYQNGKMNGFANQTFVLERF
jgi:sodium-dependent phosphate cotransporter